MKNIFFFDSMLTPKIITFVYWIMLIAVIVTGVMTMFNSYSGGFVMGLVYIVGGAVSVRIWCELLIVLFKMHENLQRIADKKED